jgi:hypothetical protein
MFAKLFLLTALSALTCCSNGKFQESSPVHIAPPRSEAKVLVLGAISDESEKLLRALTAEETSQAERPA